MIVVMTMMMMMTILTMRIVDNYSKDCSHHKYASNILQAKCCRPTLLLLLHNHHHHDHEHEHDDDSDADDNDDDDDGDDTMIIMMKMIQLFVLMASLLPTV